MAFIPDFEEAQTEPTPWTIVPAGVAGKGEPAWVGYVNRIDPAELERVRQPLMRLGGARPNSPAAQQAKQEHHERYIKRVLGPPSDGWTGATPANVNYLLSRVNKRLGPKTLAEIREAGGELPFSVEWGVFLLQQCWDDDFDQPLFRFAKFGAEEVEGDKQAKKTD